MITAFMIRQVQEKGQCLNEDSNKHFLEVKADALCRYMTIKALQRAEDYPNILSLTFYLCDLYKRVDASDYTEEIKGQLIDVLEEKLLVLGFDYFSDHETFTITWADDE